MASIAGVCLQSVTHERRGEPNRYGEVDYSPAEAILVRLPEDTGLVRSATGQEIEAESQGLTEAGVAVGDLVAGREVRRVSEIRERSGRVIGRRFYLSDRSR